MGNAALCVPSRMSSGNFTRILSNDGRSLVYTREKVGAAEIMLENPGMFLCGSTQLRVGQRIQGICTEEELEKGRVYILLPMDMLYSVLTYDEMKCLLRNNTAKGMKALPSAVNFSKIFPEFCLFPSNHNHKNCNNGSSDDDDDEEQKRYSRQRSWQPSLETIIETQTHDYQ